MALVWSRSHIPILILTFCTLCTSSALDGRPHPLEVSPNFANDPFPPYPAITEQDGSIISVENWRGTRLFGWKGCGMPQQQGIAAAFDDFHRLVNINGVYRDIDWSHQAAKEFWGLTKGKNALRDVTKQQIQRIFAAAEQIYSWEWNTYAWFPAPFARLWIEVRCSGGDGTGDPENACKDRKDGNDNDCDTPLQAFSDNADDGTQYSRITFCDGFFALQSFDDSIELGKKLPDEAQRDLSNWDNRARCFLHEITHHDYFMNAPNTNPYVSDLTFTYKIDGQPYNANGYGVLNSKIIRNFNNQRTAGFYSQRNADSYAWFAMAKYVQNEIGRYPEVPSAGLKKPTKPPRDVHGNPIIGDSRSDDQPGRDAKLEPTSSDTPLFTSSYCPDTRDQPPSNDPLIPVRGYTISSPECADSETVSPSNVFSGQSGTIYDQFCDALNVEDNNILTWTVNITGFKIETSTERTIVSRTWSRRSFFSIETFLKRSPPPDPNAYSAIEVSLTFRPEISKNCTFDCRDAYARIASSPCGRLGGEENLIASAGGIDVGCGTYSYQILNGQLQ